MPNFLYYKEEPNERPWNLIPDTPKARTQAIKQGAMFFTWASLSEPYKDNGQPEPVRYGNLKLDFDSVDPGQALKDLQTLFLVHLPELFDLDPYSVKYFLSGGKGLHADIPAELFNSQAGDPHLPLIYKKLVTGWKEQFTLPTLDMSLYCMGKGKMFRIPNVKRSNGRHKIPLSLEEVQGLPIKELEALSLSPREIDPVEVDLSPAPDLAALYRDCREKVKNEIKRQKSTPPIVNSLLPKEGPPCIKFILSELPKSEKTTFNLLVMNIINYFRNAGYNRDTAFDKIYLFLANYPHSTEYTTPEKRVKHFEIQWKYLEGKGYGFDCSYIKGFGFPGYAFDCKKCALNTGPKGTEKAVKSTGKEVEKVLKPLTAGISLKTLMDQKFEKQAHVIEKGILPEGGGLIIVGESGVGKSLIILEWALNLIMGWEIMGFNVPKARRVFLFQAENPLAQVQFRLERIMRGLGITNPPDHLFFSDPKAQYDLGNKKTLEAMISMIQDKGADVFMIDPLSSFHQADENKNDLMRRMLDNVTHISRETGAASTIVHHFGKPVQDRDTAYRYRGATAIKDWCDSMLAITAKAHEQKTLRNVFFNKIRHGPEHKPILMERDENFIHTVVDDDVLCPPGKVREILEGLGGYVEGQKELKAGIINAVKCKDRSAAKFIRLAVERGTVQETSEGVGKKKGYYAQTI